MGLETKKRPVVWVSFEENRVERRLAFDAWFAAGGPRPDKLQFVTSFEPLFIDEALGLQQIVEAASILQAGLVVIDPLHAAYSAGNISDGATARRVLAGVKKITQDLDCSVLIIHHLTKQSGLGLSRERMSDSGQILAAASMDWLIETTDRKAPPSFRGTRNEGGVGEGDLTSPPPDLEEEGVKEVEVPKLSPQSSIVNQQSSIKNSRLLRILGRGRGELVNRNWLINSPAPMQYELVGEGDKPLNTPLEDQILELLSVKSLTAREIAEEIGASVASVRNVMTKLIAKSHAHVRSIDGRERTYAVPRASGA